MLYYTYFVIGAMTGIQYGSGQINRRSFCTGSTMPETRLCDDNLPIIEIVEVSLYDFAGDEYPGRPCVYSDSDCGRPIIHGTQLYKDILTHCDGEITCGGFYMTNLNACAGRTADYMTKHFRCRRDKTATTIVSPTSISASSPTPKEATTTPNTTPTLPSGIIIGSPVNPPTSSGVTDAESNATEIDRCTSGDPRKDNIVIGVGVAVAFVLGVGVGVATVVVFIRRKRGQRTDKANLREGGGTEAGKANDEVVYYNVAPTVIPGEAAYSNVDITRAPGSEVYSDVDIRMKPERKTPSVASASLQQATHANLACVGAGNDTYSNIEQTRPDSWPMSPAQTDNMLI